MYKHTLLWIFFALIAGGALRAQNTIVRGTVTEARTKTPLAGASVSIEGSTNTVITDNKGAFTLRTYKNLPVTITVSFVGYRTQDAVVSGDAPVTVELQESSSQLTEVAVVGYGTQRRKT
jgi:hypothetical protein